MTDGAIIFFTISVFVLLLMVVTMGFVIWGLSKDCEELEQLIDDMEKKIKNLKQPESNEIFEPKE